MQLAHTSGRRSHGYAVGHEDEMQKTVSRYFDDSGYKSSKQWETMVLLSCCVLYNRSRYFAGRSN